MAYLEILYSEIFLLKKINFYFIPWNIQAASISAVTILSNLLLSSLILFLFSLHLSLDLGEMLFYCAFLRELFL